VMLRLP